MAAPPWHKASRPVLGRRPGGNRDGTATGSRIRRCVARCLAAVPVLAALQVFSQTPAWILGGRSTAPAASSARSGARSRIARWADDLEGVVVIPREEDTTNVEDFLPVEIALMPGDDQEGEDRVVMNQSDRRNRAAAARSSRTATDGFAPGKAAAGAEGADMEALAAAMRSGLPPPGASQAGAPAADAAALAPGGARRGGGKKRWLAGRNNAKKRKLEENEKLIAWLRKNGVYISDKADWGEAVSAVSIAIETRETVENENTGRGVVAARDIDIYEPLAKVPIGTTITRHSARKKYGAEIISENFPRYQAIALQLISERWEVGKDSFWADYIAVLPTTEEVGLPIFWDDKELETLLEGSPCKTKSLMWRNDLKRFWEQYVEEELFEKYPEVFKPEIYTWERYCWAISVIFSRCVRLSYKTFDNLRDNTIGRNPTYEKDNFLALVPYLDLLNHSPGASNYIETCEEGLELPGVVKDKFIVVKADKYYKQYDQVYLSYGPKSNTETLMMYGFCLERNPVDSIELDMSGLIKGQELEDAKEALIIGKKMQTTFPIFRDRFTKEMLRFLRLATITREDLNVFDNATDTQIYKALARKQIDTAADEASERDAMMVLRRILADCQKGYPTTLDDDEKVIKNRGVFDLLPKNHRNAIRVRYQEKLLLRACIATVDRVLRSVTSLTDMENMRKKAEEEAIKTPLGSIVLNRDNQVSFSNFQELQEELDVYMKAGSKWFDDDYEGGVLRKKFNQKYNKGG